MSNPDEIPVMLSDDMTDEELLELATNGTEEEFRAIAKHANASIETLNYITFRFCSDRRRSVAEIGKELLANPMVMLCLASGSGEDFKMAYDMIRGVATTTRLRETMLAIHEMKKCEYLSALASNRNLTDDLARRLVVHPEERVREALACNENVSVDILKILADDSDVGWAARQTLRDLNVTPDKPRMANPVAAGREASIVRIVTQGRTSGALSKGQDMLVEVFTKEWPAGLRATFAITPGDFVRIPFPADYAGLRGWGTTPEDLASLLPLADEALARVVTERVFEAAQGKVSVLTVGIDLIDGPRGSHAELVAIFDVNERRLVRWTGKSYPHASQVTSLVQVTDLESHFIEIAGERVLVLGCHDLHMLGPRGKKKAKEAADKSRYKRAMAMQRLAKKYKPTIVLQHPHGTDTPGPWIVPWSELTSMLPSVTCYASGIGYYRWSANPKAPTTERATLDRVLRLTHGGQENDVVDVVIRSR